jgi:hypothetical protein
MTDRSRDKVRMCPVPSEAISHFGLIKSCKDLHLPKLPGSSSKALLTPYPTGRPGQTWNRSPIKWCPVSAERAKGRSPEVGSILQDLQMAV